jgi:hypothetical protein
MLFVEGHHPDHHMFKHAEIDGMKTIRYNTSCLGQSSHIPEDVFCDSNCLTVQILSCFSSLPLNSLSHTYHLLEVLPIVSQLPRQWIPFSKRWFQCIVHIAIGQLECV